MRRKKERSKQGQTDTQGKATQHTQGSQAASGGTRTHDTLYSRQSALPTELPRQLSWLGPSTCTSCSVRVYMCAGGLGLGILDECIVGEELAYGCTGISTVFITNMLAVSECVCE